MPGIDRGFQIDLENLVSGDFVILVFAFMYFYEYVCLLRSPGWLDHNFTITGIFPFVQKRFLGYYDINPPLPLPIMN